MRFPESMKAGRFLYSTEHEYAGRLFNVTKRSIENQADDIVLLRLEFEIFVIDLESTPAVYLPTGGIASRDIVITKQAGSDERVADYAKYLRIERPSQVANWYVAERKASQGKEPWIRIRFGKPDEDHRQPFEQISELDKPKSKQIKPSGSTKEREKFWRPSEVRQLLRDENNNIPSEDTVKRFVDRRKSEFDEELVRVTTGRQRRINWYLCWHLWEAEKCSG